MLYPLPPVWHWFALIFFPSLVTSANGALLFPLSGMYFREVKIRADLTDWLAAWPLCAQVSLLFTKVRERGEVRSKGTWPWKKVLSSSHK